LDTIGLITYEHSFINRYVDYDIMVTFAESDIEQLAEWLELPEYAKQVLIRKIIRMRASDSALSPTTASKTHVTHRKSEYNGITKKEKQKEDLRVDIKHDKRVETPKKYKLESPKSKKMTNPIHQN